MFSAFENQASFNRCHFGKSMEVEGFERWIIRDVPIHEAA